MRIKIIAFGRLRGGAEKDLLDDYCTRFDRTGRALALGPVEVIEVEDKKGGGMRTERALIEKSLPIGAKICAMDERGRGMTSPDFAQYIANQRDQGCPTLSFVIGGADGIDPNVLQRADLRLSLGTMVWPHMLARVMLAEQLYRATSILAGSPYHRV